MKASELDKKFDEGEEDILDQEAKRLGVPRQSIIKIWISERLDKEKVLHRA